MLGPLKARVRCTVRPVRVPFEIAPRPCGFFCFPFYRYAMSPPAAYACTDKDHITMSYTPTDQWLLLSTDTSTNYTLNRCLVRGSHSKATITTSGKAVQFFGAATEQTGLWGCQVDDQDVQWFDGTGSAVGASINLCWIAGLDGQSHKGRSTSLTNETGF